MNLKEKNLKKQLIGCTITDIDTYNDELIEITIKNLEDNKKYKLTTDCEDSQSTSWFIIEEA